jgi:sulfate transport system permease protein
MASNLRVQAGRRRPEGAARGVLFVAMAWALALLVVPLVFLVVAVAGDAARVARELTSAGALDALARSVIVAGIVVGVNTVLGVAGALVLVRDRFVGRRVLDALVDLPLALSPVMTGLAFLLLFGRDGLFAPVLAATGVRVAFALPGVVLATCFVTLPFVLREAALVLEEVGDSEEQAAATLGATPWQTFWRVTLPNLRVGLVPGLTLTLARALGEFGAVLVVGGAIGGRTETATTFLHGALEERRDAAAYGMALVLAALSVALLAFLQRDHEDTT